jgi:hypothetical protein
MAMHPFTFPEAFFADDQAAHESQAALLLFLGLLAHREHQTSYDFVTTTTPLDWDELGIEDDYLELGIPERIRALQEIAVTQYGLSFLSDMLARDGIEARGWLGQPGEEMPDIGTLQAHLASRLFESPDYLNVAKLVAVSLHHVALLVRVAAASTSFDVLLDAGRLAGPVLLEGTYSEDSLVRDLAATALARVAPGHPRIVELTLQGVIVGESRPSNTSLIVHGTWARTETWWQPGGDFHDYLLNSVDGTLYAGSDRYEWSGGYSDQARAIAALELVDWTMQMNWYQPDLFTHSHGGNVAMLANRALDIGRLVMLSCPVHKKDYWPVFGRVQKVVSIRVHMDLVILADRGGQRFRDPNIEENVLPLWFDHSKSHDDATWTKYNVPSMI